MANDLSVKDILKLKNMQPVSLTTSVSGSDGTCTAEVSAGVVKIKIVTGTQSKIATATINTPFGFEILDVAVQGFAVNTKEWTVTIKNNTDTIVAVNCATADIIKRPTTSFDATYAEFAAGDNDLVVTLSGSSLGTAVLALTILHV